VASSENSGNARVIGFGNRCIYQTMAHKVLQEWGIKRYQSLEYASLEMIKQTVINGMGIALVPKIAVTHEVQIGKLALLHVNKKVMVSHGMIALRGKEQTASVNALRQTILE
jgi:DNA-binding transcriptional LysR family regulator